MAGMMFGRPFIGDIEDDLAWCGADPEVPAATTGAFEPGATTGVADGFFDVPAAEAYDGVVELLAADPWLGEVISNNVLRLRELEFVYLRTRS